MQLLQCLLFSLSLSLSFLHKQQHVHPLYALYFFSIHRSLSVPSCFSSTHLNLYITTILSFILLLLLLTSSFCLLFLQICFNNIVAMRGRGDRFNGILVRFNKKAMLKPFSGPVFSLSRANITSHCFFSFHSSIASFISETCKICRFCTLPSLTLFLLLLFLIPNMVSKTLPFLILCFF